MTDTITHIKDLIPDDANARRHNPRNIGMLVDALHEVGAARSIVIDENNMIICGNATVEAAAIAGIEKVRVVQIDGNEILAAQLPPGCTDFEKQRIALYDNRVAELAEWDAGVLMQLQQEAPNAMKGMFREDEMAVILAQSAKETAQETAQQQQEPGTAATQPACCPQCGCQFEIELVAGVRRKK